ncbi:hypothetical protein TanjilG_32780 [Lupinus angustifolius]|uniref:Uncharacterized protein n=1 Tax=Lupinus angustifolius TaxID=3871 RepID=A0A4P1RG06_LUPAN|nr:hypothetical protein TanjilG_32780 [Lupinus angustifolius]
MDEINELITELQGDDARDSVIPETRREILEGNYVNDVIASMKDEVHIFSPMNNETSEINKVSAAGKSHGIQQSSESNELLLNNSLYAEPKLSASTTFWSSVLQEFGVGNPYMNVKNPLINSWTSSGSPSNSSQSIAFSSGTTESINLQCPKVIPTRGVFALAPDHAVNSTSTVQFGPIASDYVQPSSSSWNQMCPFIGNASTRVSGLLGQNLFSHKRDRMSAFGSVSPTTRGMPQRFDPPSVIPSVPMELQLDYVQTWEGSISEILQNRAISFMEARAYKKVTTRDRSELIRNLGVDNVVPIPSLKSNWVVVTCL